ncbi:hypothetical protein FB446DRAFT_346322 [Lentinula raphanica]|nr:hypothetical protein FB446DRAFT_346322 [Lentinula raphanica]
MSRFTASPFHKPSPFEFPREPVSPPETMSEHMGSAHPTNISVLGAMPAEPHNVDSEPAFHSPSPEPAGARFRRVSSLAYHSSGLRERAVQRSSKFFVVVIPPPALLQEHGQLGHTLSLGPRHRLSQGMLLPLFPTMYGQLSAIAKEFNFPSTTGICLYFHFTENGITATPRISDESWQMIWSNVFDPSIPSPRVPIVGKLEFDIDIRHARWYAAWIASAHRENVDVPASVGPSTTPSLAHFRGDSRVTEVEINFQDDQVDNESVSPPSVARTGRHVPRKLSLVDRLDSSLRAVARSAAPQISPERSAAPTAHALSPIYQEDEPKTARLEDSLAKRVKTWRASASLTHSALSAKGQTSLEPANLPNTMSLDNVVDTEDVEELNLEDFAWSVSSLGPNDWEEGSVLSGPRLPSIHLANRMEASVCMTPSICTSFGPSDYTLPSPIPSYARVMTPDIAHRMFEDCPPTPSTATSWGPPSEYPPSPMSSSRVSSVDLGERAVFSPPPTPMTATSWGPSSEYPPSPISYGRPRSIHLGDRVIFSPPPTPSTATSWGPASWPASPVTPFYVHTPDVGQRTFDPEDLALPGVPWKQVWPYNQAHVDTTAAAPWSQIWPYFSHTAAEPRLDSSDDASTGHSMPHLNTGEITSPVSVNLPCSYPSLKIYPDVYPHFDLYPGGPSSVNRTPYLTSVDIYPPIDENQRSNKAIDIGVASAWPVFDIYPAVRFEQPDISYTSLATPTISVRLPYSYPMLKIYPSVYPYFDDLYPARPSIVEPTPYITSLDIYPAVDEGQHSLRLVNVKVVSAWPTFEIYPPIASIEQSLSSYAGQAASLVSVRPPCSYPSLRIYPSIYPYFDDIYPAEPSIMASQSRSLDIHLMLDGRQQGNRVVPVNIASGWPNFELYPPVAATARKSDNTHASERLPPVSVRIPCSYPSLKIYPSVYPHFDLYPDEPRLEETATYPHFCIYQPLTEKHSVISKEVQRRQVEPAVMLIKNRPYPLSVSEIYPSVQSAATASALLVEKESTGTTIHIPWAYPIIDLYPSVYPHVIPYPSVGDLDLEPQHSSVLKASRSRQYPDFTLYPSPQYPDFDLYPTQESTKDTTAVIANRYGVFDLYPAVYPHVVPYPSAIPVITPTRAVPKKRVIRSHMSLHNEVFPDGNVSTPSGMLSGIGKQFVEVPRAHRSHFELHTAMFKYGYVPTPSGSISQRELRTTIRPEVPPRPVGARVRSGSISQRPLSSATPTYGLPPRPNFRLSIYDDESSAALRSENISPPPSTAPVSVRSSQIRAGVSTTPSPISAPLQNPAPLRRVVSSSAPTRTSSLRGPRSGLKPVSEVATSSLERSASMGLRGSVLPPSTGTDPRFVHQKRDSMVLRRVRAFEETESDSPPRSLTQTLKEFPLPPPPPPPTGGLPPVPTRRTSSLAQSRS